MAEPNPRPDAAGPLLEVAGLSHSFDRRPVLRDLSFRLEAGEVVAVTGPNGAGKSTLVRIAAGLLRPRGGRIVRPGEAAIGLASPDLDPWYELSAMENLEFLARIRGRRGAAAFGRDWLLAAGFPERSFDVPAGSLSTGQRQRLKLAMAWCDRPRLLLLDEPSTNLDAGGRKLVGDLIDAARRDGAVLLATNDPGEAALTDRNVVLELLR